MHGIEVLRIAQSATASGESKRREAYVIETASSVCFDSDKFAIGVALALALALTLGCVWASLNSWGW